MKGNMSQSQNETERKNAEDIYLIEQELKSKVDNSRKVNGQTLESDVNITNVENAEKLKTARTIGATGAVTSTPTAFDGSGNILIPIDTIREAYLSWGGRHQRVNLSPIDIALLPELSANRLAFIPDSAVKFERSADAGATWTDVSADFDGTMLCTDYIDFGNGNTITEQSVNKKHRITIDCTSGGVYCELVKVVLRVSTEGATGCRCLMEVGDTSETTVWTTVADTPIQGWDGWNVININNTVVGVTKINANRYVRLTFSISALVPNHHNSLRILGLRFISNNFYNDSANQMATRGEIYKFDKEKSVTFPNNLSIQGNTLKIGSTTLTETQLKSLLALL